MQLVYKNSVLVKYVIFFTKYSCLTYSLKLLLISLYRQWLAHIVITKTKSYRERKALKESDYYIIMLDTLLLQ